MNFFKKINLFNISFLPIISITPICSSLSFKEYNVNNFKFTYEYIHSFSQNEYNFSNSNNQTIWQNNEILFQSNDFQIKFDSQNILGEFYLDLYSYNVNKWYFIKINYDPTINLNLLSKIQVNNDISNVITSNWLNDVTGVVTMDVEMPLNGDKSIILKDGFTSFQSSWGVENQSCSVVETQLSLDKMNILESLKLNMDDKSVDIEKIVLKNLKYIPLIEILDPPVWYATWNQQSIFVNNNLISNSLNNKNLDILLPNGADSGQEWWKWFTNGKDKSYMATLIELTTSIISLVVAEIPGLEYLSPAIEAGGLILNYWVFQKLNEIKFDYNKNKILYDDYYDLIISKGYSVDFNPIDLNLESENKIIVKSNIQYAAKATAIFGDGTSAKIFSNPAVASMECELRKYVEK